MRTFMLLALATAVAACCVTPAEAGEISLRYKGAFRIPNFDWGCQSLAYNPSGNGGLGSLYGYFPGGGGGMVEFSVPPSASWLVTNDPSILPGVSILNGPWTGESPYGLEYLSPLPGQTSGKLYFGKPKVGHAYMDTDFTNKQGGWLPDGLDNRRIGDYIFEIPESWRPNVGGKPLVTGSSWSDYGKGPDLYAYDPFPNTEGKLPAQKLLEYKSSNPFPGWESGDSWNGGAWVEVGSDSAVIFGGLKYVGGVPRGQLVFYNPDDFVAVLNGGNLYDPAPYKSISISDRLFAQDYAIEGMAYDRPNQILLATVRAPRMGQVVLAWDVVVDAHVPQPGDANDDAVVDGADYTLVADNYGVVGVAGFGDGGWYRGNLNDDDVVDEVDAAVWQTNYTGQAVTAAAVASPAAAGAPASAEDYDWVTAMRHVHREFKDRAVPAIEGTISQFGDSISDTAAFFTPLRSSHQNVSPEDQVKLSWLQNYINPACWNWKGGSYGNQSSTTVDWGLRGMDTWLANYNPEMAVIMWGTNDLIFGPTPPVYTNYMRLIVQKCKANGTVPILTTIPPRHGRDATDWVEAVREVARTERVPLIDLYDEVLTRRPHNPPTDTWDGADPMWSDYSGYEVPTLIAGDGVHLSNWSGGKSNFDPEEGLNKNGLTLRNYLTLLKMHEVYEQVLSQPAPEPLSGSEVVYDQAELPDGKYAYTLKVHGNDFRDQSMFADVTIEATTGQIDTGTSAVLEPFASNAVETSIGSSSVTIKAGTGLGSQYEQADLAYIVCDGGLRVTGSIGRDGQIYPVDLTISASLVGDLNGDGVIDAADLLLLASSWATEVGDPGFDARCDLNGDGSIDAIDLLRFARQWPAQ